MYYNFGILAVLLTASLIISFKMLKAQANQEETKLLSFNAISLLFLNAIGWGVVLFLSPDVMFNEFNKGMLGVCAIVSVAMPLLEMKYPSVQKMAMPIYTIIGWGIMAGAFDLRWELIALFGIFWGTFVFLFDKFNTEANIASNSIVIILFGIGFLNLFLPTSLSVMFLAVIAAISLLGFYVASKSDIVHLQISKPALHGYVFLIGMFFMYIASLGYFFVAIIIPAYFIMEHIAHYLILGVKKLFKKDTPTVFFFQTAINRGSNYAALNRYIRLMLIVLIMLASVYNPGAYMLFLLGATVIPLRMFMDFYKWGERRPTLRESFKQSIADAKLATNETKKNMKFAYNKLTKKDKKK